MVEHIGNGRMLVALSGVSIDSVFAPFPGVGMCALFPEYARGRRVKTEYSGGVRRCTVSGTEQMRTEDIIDPAEPVLVRRVESYDRITFKLVTAPSLTSESVYGEGYSQIVMSARETFITLTVRGNAVIDGTDGIIIRPGKSEMVICGGQSEKDAVRAFAPPAYEQVYERAMAARESAADIPEVREATALQCGNGCVLHSAASAEFISEEQYGAVKLFCASGLHARARSVIDGMMSVCDKNGYLPFSWDADGNALRTGAFPGAVCSTYPVLCLYEYHKHTARNSYIKKHLPLAGRFLAQGAKLVKGGHLPFNGCEEPAVAGRDVLCGSRRSDEMFTAAVDAFSLLGTLTGSCVRERRALERSAHAVRAALSDYGDGGVSTQERLRRCVMPGAMVTYCEDCLAHGRTFYQQTCLKGAGGRYLCPICYAREKTK